MSDEELKETIEAIEAEDESELEETAKDAEVIDDDQKDYNDPISEAYKEEMYNEFGIVRRSRRNEEK
tara:strand:- start:126 stop:326 length:201 start_codon:yes stop_codon:yes gene_type:complete